MSAPTPSQSRPFDDVILLAALLDGQPRFAAEELGWVLRSLGVDASAQQIAGWLRRLAQESCPTIESKDGAFGMKAYRLTRFGLNQLENRWPTLGPLIREHRQRLERRAGR